MTTYSAQGTTADQAFVMVDPSMDKQELYVAASRTRGETFIYATPEIQSHREEIAPMPDRCATLASHRRSRRARSRAACGARRGAALAVLRPSDRGAGRKERGAADRCYQRSQVKRQLRDLQERIERAERQVERYDAQRERAQELKRRFRKDELARIDRDEARSCNGSPTLRPRCASSRFLLGPRGGSWPLRIAS